MRSVFDPEYQAQSIESKIVVALERISEAFRKTLWGENKKYNLSPLQLQLMIFILYHGHAKPGVARLAEEFNVSKATASESVNTLVQKGYLYETTDPADARRKILSLTVKGEKLAREVSLFANSIRDQIGPVPIEDKEKLLSVLLELIHKLQLSGIISLNRMCFNCRYFMRSNDSRHPHYCRLLEKPLSEAELRIDCPEFEIVK